MRISLVTPCLNQASFIRATLDSVLNQNHDGLEYVVVDGGSTDGTLAVLDDYQDSLAALVVEPDGGMYEAVAKGFAKSSGEVMGWINADDIHLPWTLSVVAEVFASFPEVEWITSLHPLAMDERGRVVRGRSRRRGFSAAEYLAGGYFPAPERPGALWIQQESTFWRRSLWERAGGFDPDLKAAGDFALWGRFFAQARLVGVDTPLAAFRRRAGQLSRSGRYEAEAAAALKRLGGRPRGAVGGWLAWAAERFTTAGGGQVCRWDWDAGRWRLDG
ncbi:MAG: glycosyltransferase family 2 protein [Actinomycetota bacterium]